MNAPMDAAQRWRRWSGFLLGGIILFWLPIEDVNLTAAATLAAAVCFWFAILFGKRWNFQARQYVWAGLVSGLCVGPVGFFLMVFKIGLHSHSAPDFTLAQLFQLLKMSPLFAGSGFLLGWSVHLYRVSRRQ